MSAVTVENVYAAQFAGMLDRLPGRRLAWVERLRENAMQHFLALGFPTTRLENWKYTNVAPIRRTTFLPASAAEADDGTRFAGYDAAAGRPALQLMESYPAPRLVFVNGMFNGELSSPSARNGPQIQCLSEALRDPLRAAALEPYLGRCVSTAEHAFAAWNTAFFTDGACLEVSPGTVLEEPVQLVFISDGTLLPEGPWACYPRNLIVAGEASQVTFIETFLGLNGPYLTNAVTEIIAGPGAVIDYYKVERESAEGFHVAAIGAQLDRDASLTSHSMSFGGALVRNDLNVTLGEGSNCTLNGLFAVDGQRLVDNHTHIDHREPHATSRELYKGLLAEQSEGVFNGAITVRENAAKTDAVQHNKNLLLSERAQINTKPQLEIRASDVRCFHGATIGQLDEDAAFYLRSRGLGDAEARQILVHGFAGEIMNSVRVPLLRDQLERLLGQWLEDKPGSAHGPGCFQLEAS